jgi:hypothetical protein
MLSLGLSLKHGRKKEPRGVRGPEKYLALDARGTFPNSKATSIPHLRYALFLLRKLCDDDLPVSLRRDIERLGRLGCGFLFVTRFDDAKALAFLAEQHHFPAGHQSNRSLVGRGGRSFQ